MKLDSKFVFILCVVMFTFLGCVSASDNQSATDALSVDLTADVNEVAIDTSSVESDVAVAVDDDKRGVWNITEKNSTNAVDVKSDKLSSVATPSSEEDDVLELPADRDTLGYTLGATNFKGLRDAVNSYNQITLNGHVSAVYDDYRYSNAVPTTGIAINKAMTIEGNGNWAIDANYRGRIFNIDTTGTVIFRNVVFREGTFTGTTNGGGAITISDRSHVSFENCKFLFSKGPHGGAVYLASKDVNFTGCYFYKNNATTAGAGVYVQYGGNARFERCIFDYNRAIYSAEKTGFGAGIHFGMLEGDNHPEIRNVNILNCNFTNNVAENQGAAVNLQGYIYNLRLEGCRFENNTAPMGGAGLLVLNDTYDCNIINNVFINNEGERRYGAAIFSGILYNCNVSGTFENNVALKGGAVSFDGSTDNSVISCNFINNEATSSTGGALTFLGSVNNTIFKNSNFTLNTAAAQGGAVYIPTGSFNVYFENCNFTRNTADNYGGAVWYSSNGGSFTDCTFDGNIGSRAGAIYLDGNNVDINNCNFTNNRAPTYNNDLSYHDGGAIYWISNTGALINNSRFINNYAAAYCGAICFDVTPTITIANSAFSDNEAIRGGAVFMRYNIDKLTLTNTNFTNNYASRDFGGGICVEDQVTINSIEIDSCHFTGNRATTYGGGAFLNAVNDVSVTNSVFSNNTAGSEGAGINIGKGSSVSVDGCNFTGNVASNFGGGLYVHTDVGSVTTSNSNFNKNSAGTGGGAILVNRNANTIEITGSNFTSNKATGGDGGGAVHISSTSGSAVIENCNFTSNEAKSNGGAVYMYNNVNDVSITESSFDKNNATNGGAVYSASGSGSVEITLSEFTNNAATSDGGAVYANIPYEITSSNTFSKNSAKRGGAITLNGGDSTVDGAVFTNNTATGDGQAIYAADGTNTISHSTFEGKNHISIDNAAEVTLRSLNEINPQNSDYSVDNNGKLSLYGNHFNNTIINKGIIKTHVNVTIRENKTYTCDDYFFPLNATIVDDENNIIASYSFNFTSEWGDSIPASDDVKHEASLRALYYTYTIKCNDTGLENKTVMYSIIDVVTKSGSYTWLQEQIDNLSGSVLNLNVNITFDPEYDLSPYNRYVIMGVNFTNGMLYNKTFTLKGNNTFISGLNQARIFVINVSDITIRDVDLVNGSTIYNGGAFYINKTVSNVNLINATFENNTADGYGGAIYWDGNGNNILIEDVVFNNNSASDGGAIQFYAGSTESYNTIDIIRCNFTNNRDLFDDNWGGSAIAINQGHDFDVSDSIFDSNLCADNGAVLLDYCDDVRFTGVNFTNNNANKSGGAVYFKNPRVGDNGNANFTDCLFENNHASLKLNFDRDGMGGAMYLAGNKFTLTNNTFKGNGALGTLRSGGAIYSQADNVNIIENNFTNNSATGYGGAFYTEAYVAGLNIIKSTFTENSATSAGAIDLAASTNDAKIINSTFTKNTASNAAGAIWASGDGNEISGCNFTDNSAGNYGAVYYVGNNLIMDSAFTGNDAGENVGALYYSVSFKDKTLTGLEFINNHADGDIAALQLVGDSQSSSNITLYELVFKNNSAGANYGALYFDVKDSAILYSNFTNNSANNVSAVYAPQDNIDIAYSNFKANKAKEDGAVFVSGQNDEISYCNFDDNTGKNGSAVYFISQNGVIKFSNFTRNDAKGSGTVYIVSQEVSVLNSEFKNNTVTNYGGAIMCVNNHDLFVNASVFDNNRAGEAGAIYAGPAKIMNSNFTRNKATNGAALVLTTTFDVIHCLFADNAATGKGTVYVLGVGEVSTIENSTFLRNNADNGGAIYFGLNDNWGPRLYIRNGTFINNTAIHNGGAIYYLYAQGVLCRDYNNFDNHGINLTNGRTTVPFRANGVDFGNSIVNSYFENNRDYLFQLVTYANGTQGIVEIYVPKDADRYTTVVVINLTDENGTVISTVIDDPVEFRSHFSSSDVGVFSIQFPQLPEKATYNVTVSFGDAYYVLKNGTGSFTTADFTVGDFYTLQTLINNTIAAGGKELNLTRSFTFTIGYDTGEMYINSTIKINGFGKYYINALGRCKIFRVEADNVVLEGIEFMNGNTSGVNASDNKLGGAIYWNGTNGSIINSVFYNNSAEYGGGVYFAPTAPNCTIINTTFDMNIAEHNGGAIDCNATNMALNNTIFIGNVGEFGAALCREVEATGGHGYNNTFIANHATQAGAALGWVNAKSIHIDKYTFIDNTAEERGGAIYVGNGSDNCTILNCYFEGNNVSKANNATGGAIDFRSKLVYIINSNFTNNNAYEGGAVYLGGDQGFANVTNSIFIENHATIHGGAIDVNTSSVHLNNSRFVGNIARAGGALNVQGEGMTSQVYNSEFIANNATNGTGGAINWVASAGQIFDSNFTYNEAINGGGVYFGGVSSNSSISGVIFDGNIAYENGGAISWNSTGGNLSNTLFKNNVANFGAALCREAHSTSGFGVNNTFIANHARISGAALGWMAAKGIYIENYTFINNTAEKGGGAIFVSRSSSDCVINSSRFIGNHIINGTGGRGGAIECTAFNLTVLGSNFTSNNAHEGGAIFLTQDAINTTVYDSIFTDNGAGENGGAINWESSGGNLNNSKFYNNSAGGNGGAVFVGNLASSGYISYSIFEGNNASGRGGAVDWFAAGGNILNSTFKKNNANYGGAVFVDKISTHGEIIDSTFISNHANFNGGAIDWNATSGNLTGSRFIKNTAGQNGGAVFVGSNSTTSYITDSVFDFNSASGRGGAVDWYASNGHIANSNFTNNSAYYGGALFVGQIAKAGNVSNSNFIDNHAYRGGAVDWNASFGDIMGSLFERNTAECSGGAIFIGISSEDGVIYNSTFRYNHADRYGGAIDWNATRGSLNNATFYMNTAGGSGGALFVGKASTNSSINDTRFINNSAVHKGGAIDWNASNGKVAYSTFENNSAEGDGGAIFAGAGAFRANITHTKFITNKAFGNGGAVVINNVSNADLINATFANNWAANNGGAMFVGHCDNFILDDAKFRDNVAGNDAGALYWEGQGGNLGNVEFTHNHAGRDGGAVVWNGANGHILTANFTNNWADRHGGAVTWEFSDGGSIKKSTFTSNNATNNGGAIFWTGDDDDIVEDSTFTSNNAGDDGGAIAWYNGGAGKVINSTFKANKAIKNGGAIMGFNCSNSYIINSTFESNAATGAYNPEGIDYGEGGAVAWSASHNVTVSNTKFNSNRANYYGGALYGYDCDETHLYNLTFNENSALCGGAITWDEGDDITIDDGKFYKNSATEFGADLFLLSVNGNINNSKFDSSSVDYNGGSMYIEGNMKITNATMTNYTSKYSTDGRAITFALGTSVLENSSLSGENAIEILSDANVRLLQNNITNSEHGEYAVLNHGTLYLNKNNFDNVIINDAGQIISKTHVTVLDGINITVEAGSTVELYASIVDDNNNTIVVRSGFRFQDLSTRRPYKEFNSTYFEKHNYGNYHTIPEGMHLMSAVGGGLTDVSVTPATIFAKTRSNIVFDIYQENQGEKVTITLTLLSNTGRAFEGLLHLYVGDSFYKNATIFNNQATFELYNLSANTYPVTARFDGDNYHFEARNNTYFVVELRNNSMNIIVKDIYLGQNQTIVVNTTGNGTVLIILSNGKSKEVKVINGTATWENITDLKTGDYNITAIYLKDSYYQMNYTTGNFMVHKLNTTIDATPTNIKFGDNEIITVNVNENATGFVKITIGGRDYTEELSGGIATFNISGLAVGDYINYTVTYLGDENFTANSTNVTFKVYKNTTDIDVKFVSTIVAGGNAIFNVTLTNGADLLNGLVILHVGEFDYAVIVRNGFGQFVLRNVSAGSYPVNATFIGDSLYDAASSDNYTLTVTKKPSNLTIEVIPTGNYYSGNNITFKFTLKDGNVPLNTDVVFTLNDVDYHVNVVDGEANITFNNVSAGPYTYHASYAGNYKYNPNTTAEDSFTVNKRASNVAIGCNATYGPNVLVPINITVEENHNCTVVVNVNGKDYAVKVTNGIGWLRLSDLAVGPYTVKAKFDGDFYFEPSNDENSFNVTGYNLTKNEVTLEVLPTTVYAGDNATIRVNVTGNFTGTAIVKVKNMNYTVVITNGTGNITLTNLSKDTYPVEIIRVGVAPVTLDSQTLNVIKYNTSVAVDVPAARVTIGQNATITVTMTNVTDGKVIIEIDGANHTVALNNGVAKLNVSFAAGLYHVHVYYLGDFRHEPSKNMTETITFGDKNITVITINVVDYTVEVDGTIVFNVTTNHDYNLTVKVGDMIVTNDTDGYYRVSADDVKNYVITATTSEDQYWSAGKDSKVVKVYKHASDFEIIVPTSNVTVGQEETITVNMTHNETGSVIMQINGANYTVAINSTTGLAVKNIALPMGNYTVYVYYIGDDKYNASNNVSKSFNVTAYDLSKGQVNITVLPGNERLSGENVTLKVDVIAKFNGTAVVRFGDVDYSVVITKGTGNITLNNLSKGKYDVYLVSVGECVLNHKNTTVVVKKRVSDIKVNVNNSYAPNTLVPINIAIEGNYNGTVLVNVNNRDYAVKVTNGIGLLNLTGLAVGPYVVNATVEDDFYFESSNDVKPFNVTDYNRTNGDVLIFVSDRELLSGESVTLTVNVTGRFNGTATVKFGDVNYSVAVANGNGSVTIDNLAKGNYPVTLVSVGVSTVNLGNGSVNVTKRASNINITVNDTYGPNVLVPIDVTVGYKYNGTVIVSVDGIRYVVDVANGQGLLKLTNLTIGEHKVVANFTEDYYFYSSGDDDKFNVTGYNLTNGDVLILVSDRDLLSGQSVTLTINITGRFNGTAVVKFGDVTYGVKVTNGARGIVLDNLTKGLYNVTLVSIGVIPVNLNNGSVNVSKRASNVAIGIKDTYGPNVLVPININVKDKYNGTVVVNVNGADYAVKVTNGIGWLNLTGLNVGKYDVNATVAEDFYFESSSDVKSFNVTGYNLTNGDVNLTIIPKAERWAGESVTMKVDVTGKFNGTAIVEFGDRNYSVVIANGVGSITLNNLSKGIYNVTLVSVGVSPVNIKKTVTASKKQSNVHITVVGNSFYPKDMVPIKVTDGNKINGIVVVNVNGTEYSVTLKNGVGWLNLTGLNVGNYKVNASFAGNYYFESSWDDDSFDVSCYDGNAASLEILPDTTRYAGDDVTIRVNVTGKFNGTAVVKFDDVDYSVVITKGSGNVTVSNLAKGTYPVVLVSVSNEPANIAPQKVLVRGVICDMPVASADIALGDNLAVNVTLPSDANGVITVNVNGTEVVQGAKGGLNTIYVTGLAVGDNYLVNVSYAGNYKYEPVNNSTKASVKPIKTTSDDIGVDDLGNGTVYIYVHDNATGNVTVIVGNDTYNATVINGTAVITLTNVTPGEYNVTVIYSGDENHTNVTFNTTVRIDKHPTPMSIEVHDSYVGSVVKVTVTVPEGLLNKVILEIDGKSYTNSSKGNVAVFYISGLTAGDKTVTASYAGDKNYTANSTTAKFTVSKVKSTVKVTTTPIIVGETAVIKITAPSDINGRAVVNVDGVNYTVEIKGGSTSINVDNLLSGTHSVEATYLENDKYLQSTGKTELKVSKVSNPNINGSAENATVGEPVIVTVELPSDATGNVTITIGGVNGTVPIAGGNNTIFVPGIPVGEHDVTITYNGDDKYESQTVTDKVTVSPIETTQNDIDVDDLGNGTLVITVPENATGNVTVVIDGENYTAVIENGTATVDITNATPGEHNITVIYSGDENHTGVEVNKTISIPKYSTPISIEVEDAMVGDKVKVTVKLPDDATGKVIVEIDGKSFVGDAKNGQAIVEIEGLLSGNKTVVATYVGDKNYSSNATTAEFKVSKHTPEVNVSVDDITTLDDAVVKVTVTGDATGYVIVKVGDVEYGINITDGKDSVNVPNLAAGEYDVKVTYLGDEKYLEGIAETSFKVSKADPNMKVSVENTTEGSADVKVTLPGDATGDLTVVVDGTQKITVPANGGVNNVHIPGLDEGKHNVDVTYSGDARYTDDFGEETFDVTKLDPNMKVKIENVSKAGADVKVTLPEDATGTVTVVVDGKQYTVPAGGESTVHIPGLTPGEHKVDVVYSGDDRYSSDSDSQTITVESGSIATLIVVDARFTRVANDYRAGERGAMFYGVLMDTNGNLLANKTVQIAVNGPIYNVTTDSEGRAGLQVNLANANIYTYALFFRGDEMYNATHIASSKLTVVKKNTTIKASGVTLKVSKQKTISVALKTTKNPYDGKTYLSKNKKIIIEIGEKTFKGYTNAKGVAKIKVKLTKKGNYKATVRFDGDNTYAESTKTIQIKVK